MSYLHILPFLAAGCRPGHESSKKIIQAGTGRSLILTLLQYHSYLSPRDDLARNLDADWAFNWTDFERYAKDSGIILPTTCSTSSHLPSLPDPRAGVIEKVSRLDTTDAIPTIPAIRVHGVCENLVPPTSGDAIVEICHDRGINSNASSNALPNPSSTALGKKRVIEEYGDDT